MNIIGGGAAETYLYPIYGGIILLSGLIVGCTVIVLKEIESQKFACVVARFLDDKLAKDISILNIAKFLKYTLWKDLVLLFILKPLIVNLRSMD